MNVAARAVSVCSGVGMLDHGVALALESAGGALRPVLYVEREAFAAAHLVWQMEQGFLAPAPIWSDLGTAAGPSCGAVVGAALGGGRLDLLLGGIPCQPWSHAGKRRGDDDERDLWPATRVLVERWRPLAVFIENVPGILSRPQGAYRIVADLQGMGYRASADVFSSAEVGANHLRRRVFILAVADAEGSDRGLQLLRGRPDEAGAESGGRGERLADAGSERLGKGRRRAALQGRAVARRAQEQPAGRGASLPRYAPGRSDFRSWATALDLDPSLAPAVEPEVRGMADGLASRVDRLRAIGNGVDSLVAAVAFRALWDSVGNPVADRIAR